MTKYRITYAAVAEALLAFVAAAWGFLYARYLLATLFNAYDDEGYFLLALARYFRAGPLDPETYTVYGPFYYFTQQAWYGLTGLPVSHDAERLGTLFCWMACSSLAGIFVYRVSRSVALAAAGFLACARLAAVVATEPGHPQQVVVVLLTLAACISLTAPVSGARMFLLGALGAALVFTKINAGVFYLAALAQCLFCLLPARRVRTAGLVILMAYALAMPPLLAHASLWNGAAGYCLVAMLCTGATFAAGILAKPTATLPWRLGWLASGGAAAGTGLILAATLGQGISLTQLVSGLALQPASHFAGTLFRGFRLGPAPCAATVLALAALGCFAWYRERLAAYRFWLGAMRSGIGLAVVFLLVRADLTWVMPLLPLGVIPITGLSWRLAEWFPRLFVASLAATQFLQTYPVAGSQVGIASIPVLLWAFICIADGFEELEGHPGWPARAVWNGATGALTVLVVGTGMWLSGTRPWGYPYPPSRLRGAERMHLPVQQAEEFRRLAGAIGQNCSVLYTLPKMGSFNFWSGVPAPLEQYATAGSLSPVRDRATMGLLGSEPRACALFNRELLDFAQLAPQEREQWVLGNYVVEQMPTAMQQGGFEVRVSPRRISPWTAVVPDAY